MNFDAREETAVLGGNDQRMIVLFHCLVGQQDRFDQVIDRRAGADADEVGPDLAASASDSVAFEARQILATKDRFAARSVAVLDHILHHLLHLSGAESARAGSEP